MSIPDLIIPVRFDTSKIDPALQKVGRSAQDAADKAKKGFDESGKAAGGFGVELNAVLSIVSQVGGAAKGMIEGMGQEMRRAAQVAAEMAQGFAKLRTELQEVAALTGKSNSNNFTIEQAQAAAAAKLTPEKWADFQKLFQSFGGAYLEGDQNRFADTEERTAGQQATEYQQKIAEFSKAKGWEPSTTASIAGGLLQFSEGTQTPEELLARFGRVLVPSSERQRRSRSSLST